MNMLVVGSAVVIVAGEIAAVVAIFAALVFLAGRYVSGTVGPLPELTCPKHGEYWSEESGACPTCKRTSCSDAS